MNPANVNMANMAGMGGPVGAAMPMMNNGGVAPQGGPRQQLPINDNQQRPLLNTYIYEYFIRFGMFDCARALINGDHQVNVVKDGSGKNILGNGLGDDAMDTDSKDDIEGKLPDDLPAPKLPTSSDSSFLHDWFGLFWDMYSAHRSKAGNSIVNQYVNHTQQQNRLRQSQHQQQQEMLRHMRPDNQQLQYQAQLMRGMQNGNMMNLKQGGLARAAMANNQNNPQGVQMLQQAKQNNMQRDPSDMDGNRQRASSPGSTDNAPSPSKRPRLEGPFNNQPGMVNGRQAQGMPGQPMTPNAQAAHHMLLANGINPGALTPQQLQQFTSQPPNIQQKSVQAYSANLQQHHGQQMPNKQVPNAGGPQGQGSPMMAPPEGVMNSFYPGGEMGGPAGMRPVPGAAQAGAAGGSNHALQDYQMQLMLLEQQNKKRLMMARQEQDNMGGVGGVAGIARQDGQAVPGGPVGPNGQAFPETSPQAARTGASPNPADQMKRGTPQMNNGGIPSPLPEGAQSRGSPNPMNFLGSEINPNMAPHFFKGMEGNMVAGAQMNGMRPPSSHPGQQQFNGQINPQMMRQQAAAAAAQGNPQAQWPQGGPNGGQMMTQGPQGQVQGTPQQRSMPPPSAPAANAAGTAGRTSTSSPQQNAQPPTPQQSTKAAPKKKETKAAKDKRAATQKKSNANLNAAATPAGDAIPDPEAPTPATPITPVNPPSVNPANFKTGPAGGAAPPVPNGQVAAPAPATTAVPAPTHADPSQTASFSMDNGPGMVDFTSMDFANPLTSENVLDGFDFDSFLHDNDGDNNGFDFNTGFPSMEGAGEIGAE